MNQKSLGPKKSCIYCSELIKINAKRCYACGNYQNWRRYFPFSQSVLALLVALVSVISMSLPIIKDFIWGSNSSISVKYIDRPDVTVPILATNKGGRPGFMHPKAALDIYLYAKGDSKRHTLFFSPYNSPRGNLIIPENTSKQFFFYMDDLHIYKNIYEDMANDLNNSYKLEKCIFHVTYADFSGEIKEHSFVIFDHKSYSGNGYKKLALTLAAAECMGKIRIDIREKYGLFMSMSE